MAESGFDPERMLSALADREARFILIGGMAAVLHGDVGVTFCPSETSGFSDLLRDAIEIEAADRLHIFVASLEDVIRSKQAANRAKDRLALPRLRRLLDRLQGDG